MAGAAKRRSDRSQPGLTDRHPLSFKFPINMSFPYSIAYPESCPQQAAVGKLCYSHRRRECMNIDQPEERTTSTEAAAVGNTRSLQNTLTTSSGSKSAPLVCVLAWISAHVFISHVHYQSAVAQSRWQGAQIPRRPPSAEMK